MKLGLVSLGCDKNTVDSERIFATLVGYGAQRTTSLEQAEVILVNTCGFIDAAKEESIETILEAAHWKRHGDCQALVAVGCMVEQYRSEMEEALPEVDILLGLTDVDRLVPELRERGLLEDPLAAHPGTRLPLSSRHVSYLKVSEGCDHGCAFCAIPLWRGKHRSFAGSGLVAEARELEAQGTVELNLVAQDLAHYGRDLRDGSDISGLLRTLLDETSIPWLRLLYIYSAGIRDPLVELMASESRVVPYLDMPIQHAADPVLVRMRRPERQDALRHKIGWLREAIPGLTLRTTVMVGFPGETDDDFRDLLDFMEEVRFDRLGAFAFSPQPATRAAEYEDLFVPPDLANERLEELLEVQRVISAVKMAREVGRRREAIVDSARSDEALVAEGRSEDATGGSAFRATGRIRSQADDVDGVTELMSRAPLRRGQLVHVSVLEASDYDLSARVEGVVRDAPRVPVVRETEISNPKLTAGRRLPVTELGLDTVRGR
jgi:ribosomal protein S12 methylthiotransferase